MRGGIAALAARIRLPPANAGELDVRPPWLRAGEPHLHLTPEIHDDESEADPGILSGNRNFVSEAEAEESPAPRIGRRSALPPASYQAPSSLRSAFFISSFRTCETRCLARYTWPAETPRAWVMVAIGVSWRT